MGPTVKLQITKNQERRCRDWCRKWYPREAWGLLLGTFLGDAVHVDELWIPPRKEAEQNFKENQVFVPPEWLLEAEEEAKDDGLILVGDFHSHPYLEGETMAAPVQSDYDIDNAGKYPIFGIINVWPRKDKKLATRVRWWGPSIKIELVE